MTNRPTGTVTFLFTDIEGSTKLWEAHRDAMQIALARHDALLRDAIEKNHGYVFKTVGDAFCAAFSTALEGLNAALAAQRVLQTESWGDAPIKVRMALHTGTGEERDGDYFGPSLNRVARLLSTGHGGQILLSAASLELVQGQLPQDVSILDLDEHRLKDLERPQRVFQLIATDLPSDFPPLKTLNTLPNNLPLQLTSFVGREKEILEIKRLLALPPLSKTVEDPRSGAEGREGWGGATRLLTLTGAGGCGKTRLSLQIAADALEDFADGVWFIELAPLADPALVAQVVATTLGLHEGAGRSLEITLKDYLHEKNLLLILDNCEHLLAACAQFADTFLHTCPHLKILATSREALGVAGEMAYRVPSLAVPDPQHLPPIEALSQYDAVRLFIDRAISIQSTFAVNNHNAPAVAQICSRLGGIPLAIELAAARIKIFSAEEIEARLDDRFHLLTGGSRTAMPRQQTLRALIDWSFDLLSEPERVLLSRLSVFVGGWTFDAAEAVCGEKDEGGRMKDEFHPSSLILHPSDILDLLSHLIDKSLVLAEEQDGATRYRMLETIRQYAREKLLESGETEKVRARHLEFFLKFAEESKPKLRSVEQLTLLNLQRSEYENLRVAVEWAREDSSRISSVNMGLRIISALEHLGDVYALLGVGTQAITFYQKAIALSNGLTGVDKMITLRLHGKIVETVGNLWLSIDVERYAVFTKISAASQSKLKSELRLGESLAPDPEIVRLLTILSNAAWENQISPDWDAADRYARAAVEIAEKLDNPLELSVALDALGNVYFARGLLRERVQVALRRLALIRDPRFSDANQRISVLLQTGSALNTVGEYALAVPHLSEAAKLAKEILAVKDLKGVLQQFVYGLFRMDRWDEVLEILNQVRDIQKNYSRERFAAECFPIALAAGVHVRRGDLNLGAAEREEAHSIMTSISGSMDRWLRAQLY